MTDFDTFWAAFPRHEAKKDARKAWDKLKPSAERVAQMLQALDWQVAREEWQKDGGRFIPLPASWIRGERWEDERRSGEDRRQASPSGILYACPHDPPCGSRWACGKQQIAERRGDP